LIDTIIQEKIASWAPECDGDNTRIEQALYADGITVLAGVDEAGRGPLAGPVVAAAVVLPLHPPIPGIRDSKRISYMKRSELAIVIKEHAVDIGIGVVEPAEIDTINILRATNKAIRLAVDSLSTDPDLLLIDGKYLDYPDKRVAQLIKGDARCRAIAAASIIAKVTRDAIMESLHEEYPMYGFHKHKGYPTREHKSAIRMYGMSPVHRRSFNVT
jgi:ribonuclease HII